VPEALHRPRDLPRHSPGRRGTHPAGLTNIGASRFGRLPRFRAGIEKDDVSDPFWLQRVAMSLNRVARRMHEKAYSGTLDGRDSFHCQFPPSSGEVNRGGQ
jgi:hypothetical protein